MSTQAIRVLLQAITGPYEAAMARASATTTRFGATARGTSQQTGRLGGAFGGLSGKLLAGGGLVFGLSKGAKLLMSYEDALVGVGKTTGLTGRELSSLGDDLTGLAKGIRGSAEDMMGIAQSAAQLGVKGTDNILQFTEVIANMASATDLTIDSAATDMARLSNILGRPIEDVEALGSSIVALGNNMATTEPEILSLATRLAAAGRLAGIADSEVVGLAAAMSSLGVEAEAGGTAMSRVLNEITKAVGTGNEKLEVFAATAQMSAGVFAQAWKDDPAAALQSFLAGLGGLSEAQQFGVMEELGLDAARLTDVLIRTSSGAEGLGQAFDLANTAMDENVALAEEAAVANATASAAWDNLKDTLADFGRTAAGGEEGTSLLTDTLIGTTRAVENLDEMLFGAQDRFEAMTAEGEASTTMLGGFQEAMQGLIQPIGAVLTGNQEMFDESWMGGAEEYRQRLRDAAEATGALSADQALLNAAAHGAGTSIGAMAGEAEDAASPVADLAQEQREAAEQAEAMRVQNEELADQLREQTDPVFALTNALDRVRKAEENYQEVVKEHGAASQPAEEASWALFEALEGVTDASLRVGPDGFNVAIERIDALAAAGLISAQQSDDLKTALDDAKTAAEDFSGDYKMSLRVDMPSADIALLNSAARFGAGGGSTATVAIPSNVHIPGRAAGGSVDANGLYWVGEEGPELFSPSSSGRIIPAGDTGRMMNAQPGAGGTTVHQEFYLTAPNYLGDKRDLLQTMKAELAKDSRRGGTLVAKVAAQ